MLSQCSHKIILFQCVLLFNKNIDLSEQNKETFMNFRGNDYLKPPVFVMSISKRLKLALSPSVAVSLKLKFRVITITYISIAILVAMRVFSLGIFGTPFSAHGSLNENKTVTSSIQEFFMLDRNTILKKKVLRESCCW